MRVGQEGLKQDLTTKCRLALNSLNVAKEKNLHKEVCRHPKLKLRALLGRSGGA